MRHAKCHNQLRESVGNCASSETVRWRVNVINAELEYALNAPPRSGLWQCNWRGTCAVLESADSYSRMTITGVGISPTSLSRILTKSRRSARSLPRGFRVCWSMICTPCAMLCINRFPSWKEERDAFLDCVLTVHVRRIRIETSRRWYQFSTSWKMTGLCREDPLKAM
jgi:hypothetical protein